jgi:23S rRNA (cytosine1962-C5)-methyltransferase
MPYKALILKPKKERAVIHRHPWLFTGAIHHTPTDVENGEIVEIRASDNGLLGYGFFNPNSQICCRIFEFTQHPVEIDEAYWGAKMQRAYQLRQSIVNLSHTNCYRLLHAEGDFFPGIIADVYGDVVVAQILIKGTEKLIPVIEEELYKLGYKHIYLKTKTSSQTIEGINATDWLGEAVPMPLNVVENGQKFNVNVETGQKTGFFIDQRDNRELLKTFSAGKKVLNTFCYTGGFSVYALAGGATEVHSVDISKDAIAQCEENIVLNGYNNHTAIALDCFEYLKQTDVDYDIMVLDPPAFAKNARSVPNATRGYKELNMVAMKKIKPGGLIFTFSCSQNIDKMLFQKIVFGAAADARRNVRILKHLNQPPDHPVSIFHPEGEYLKGLLLWVE